MTAPLDAPSPEPVPRILTLLVCALGGEGGGILTQWLVDAAERDGYPVQATSVPGVAQRTGATTYYLELYPVQHTQLGRRRPVFSLFPVPAAVDLLVASELLEASRQATLGLPSPERTVLIAGTGRALTTQERIVCGDGRLDAAMLEAGLRRSARSCYLVDLAGWAREAGTVVSAVMFGAIAASGVWPLSRASCEAAINDGGAGAAASLRGFALAWDRVRALMADANAGPAAASPVPGGPAGRATCGSSVQRPVPPLPRPWAERYAPAVHTVLAQGVQRLREYQDEAYAQLYLERVWAVHQAELAADPQAHTGHAVTRETARWLALWMAFDDIARVAQLKAAATRFERVRREVGAGPGDLLRIRDHFRPGVPEIAALLPSAWAERFRRWDARRIQSGRPAWGWPLRLPSHTVAGLMVLRLLASLRHVRPRGSRWTEEQRLIERWLGCVVAGVREQPSLGLELARCGRLVKGYGSTHARGMGHLLRILDHLSNDVLAVCSAREAALADDCGRTVPPPSPVAASVPRTQTLHFVPRRKAAPATAPETPHRGDPS